MCNNTTVYFCYFNTSSLENDGGKTKSLSPNVMVAWSATIAVAILSPVAVVGNALVLLAIWRNPSLRTPSYILLAGLAFTDFWTGLITQPFYVVMELIYLQADPHLRPTLLKIASVTGGSASYFIAIAISLITVMSIERWLHMTRRSLITVRRASYTIAALFLLLIPLLVYRVLSILKYATSFLEIEIAFMSFLLFCLIVTSIAYFKVFKIIRSHQQQIQTNNLSRASGQSPFNFAKYKKSVFTVLYILAVFYVCYLPLAVTVGLVLAYEGEYEPVTHPFIDVLFVFVYLSSSINPILYLWRMSDIRNEVKSLVKGMLCNDN